jgi:hypothetical protein
MLKQFVFLTGNLFSVSVLQSQSVADTILVYDIATQTTSTILPVSFNTTVTSDFTSSFIGTMGYSTALSLTPPTSNLFSGSNFSDLVQASSFFDAISYPARTAVRLRLYANDTAKHITSGMLVGPNFVLTSAGYMVNFNIPTNSFINFDSIRVSPAYMGGLTNPLIPSSLVKKIYAFKCFFNSTSWEDVTLLELETPIGQQTGWTGIGFNQNPAFTTGKVFHKFSYPSGNPFSSTSVYNGDHLYYNYGYIDDGPSYTVNSNNALLMFGMSGSTFLYSNNIDYYSVGVANFSTNYNHYKINNSAFYQLKNILTVFNSTTSLSNATKEEVALNIYPNPLESESILEFEYNSSKHYSLKIFDSYGNLLREQKVNSRKVKIVRDNLQTGIYLVQLNVNNLNVYIHKLIVN